jgi:hypothetical protein
VKILQTTLLSVQEESENAFERNENRYEKVWKNVELMGTSDVFYPVYIIVITNTSVSSILSVFYKKVQRKIKRQNMDSTDCNRFNCKTGYYKNDGNSITQAKIALKYTNLPASTATLE